MNNLTKILIAVGTAGGAFVAYKLIKKNQEEKEAKEAEEKRLAEEAKAAAAAEAEKKKAEQAGKKQPYSKPQAKGYTPYQLKVIVLQGLLKVRTDGDAGTQTLGTLDYAWGIDTGKGNEDRKAEGYPNLVKNGRGVLSPDNIDYYIDTIRANKTPRQINNAKPKFVGRRAYAEQMIQANKAGQKVLHKSRERQKLQVYELSKNGKNYVKRKGDSRTDFYYLPITQSIFQDWGLVGYTKDDWWILYRRSDKSDYLIVNPNEYQAV